MPKLKTKKGAAKRFKKRGSSFKQRSANRSHLNTGMTTKRKRHLRSMKQVSKSSLKSLRQQLPYS